MKIRNILVVLGLVGLAIVIFLNIHQLKAFIHLLSSLRWYILVLIIVVQLFSYYLNALYYQSILRVFSYTGFPFIKLFEGAMAANFINYIIPSAGIAGAGFLSQVLSPEVPRGQGVLVQFMRYGLSALAVLIMLPVGILIVVVSGPENKNLNKLAITLSLVILTIAIALAAIINQESLTRKLVRKIEHRLTRWFNKFRENTVEKFIDDFYAGFRIITNRKKSMFKPMGWSLVYVLVEMLTVYLSFVAFGKWVNPGIVIMGYLMANITSVIGGAFFSFGVFEVGMVATFVALGVPFVLAVSVTLVYRIMNLLIGLPPGFYFYRKFLKS